MTETEWLAGTDPTPMLVFLRDKASDRQLRLFAVTCCRQVWYMLATNECRHAVDLSERAADDPSAMSELACACERVWNQGRDSQGFSHPDTMRQGAAIKAAAYATTSQMWHVDKVVECTRTLAARSGLSAIQCGFLRDIIGNPFHPVTIDPAFLKWNDNIVVKLAQTIYEERAFDRLPILADALEDAGCHDADILAHCRQPGPHVRGCWVIDLLTGKE